MHLWQGSLAVNSGSCMSLPFGGAPNSNVADSLDGAYLPPFTRLSVYNYAITNGSVKICSLGNPFNSPGSGPFLQTHVHSNLPHTYYHPQTEFAWLLPGGGRAWLLPGGAWDTTRYGDTINERAVRILLECIVVYTFYPPPFFVQRVRYVIHTSMGWPVFCLPLKDLLVTK